MAVLIDMEELGVHDWRHIGQLYRQVGVDAMQLGTEAYHSVLCHTVGAFFVDRVGKEGHGGKEHGE